MQVECGFHKENEGDSKLLDSGPTIPVKISFNPSIPMPDDGLSPVFIPSIKIPALIDTGASECFIDSSLATTLQLPIVNRRLISGSDGKHYADVYMAQIT